MQGELFPYPLVVSELPCFCSPTWPSTAGAGALRGANHTFMPVWLIGWLSGGLLR